VIESRKALVLLVVVLFAPFLSCRPSESSENHSSAKTLVVSEFQALSDLNPLLVASTLSSRLTELIFDGLIRLDDHLEAQPHLASSWELSKDQLTWTFHLRHGVAFHDGKELTAEDVKFTFDQLRDPVVKGMYSYSFQEIDHVVVKDKYTVEVTLKRKTASFLGDMNVGILPKHLLEGKNLVNSNFNLHPVGTGLFKLKTVSKAEIVLEANADYFLGRPALDEIIVKVYPSQESVWAGLLSGEIGFFYYIDTANYERLRQVPAIDVYSVLKPYYYILAFNVREKLFQGEKVRQALNYAINKEEIISKVLKGQGQVAAGTIYPSSWAHNPAIRPYPYDPQKALALLNEAGWRDRDGDHFLDRDGQRFEFTTYTNHGDDLKQQVLLRIQQQLFNLGIKMNVVLFDAAETGFLFRKQFEAFFPEIDAGGDPDLSYRFWHSSQIEQGFNVGSYHSSKVDQLLDAGRRTFDRAERKKIYNEFQSELFKDPPGIFLFWADYLVGVNQRIKGVKIGPAGPFANIREWYVDEVQRPRS
jgi:peptide/nickel transport system substrate-binding protein